MDLFKLVGSIFIKSDDANSQIDTISKNANNLASKVGGSMQTVGNKMTGIGKAIAPVSAAVGGALVASTKSAMSFQDSIAKVSTLVDTTKVPVDSLSKTFLDLSNKTGKSASELAEAGYQALSAGVSVENLGKFTETATNLAKVGYTSASTAVDVLTTTMNAYGKEAGTADEISNKLVKTQNLGKTTVDELASSMGKVIPTASAMGVDINNLCAGYVALTKQGIATSEATTYMNSAMNELSDSGSSVGKILKEKTGMSFGECMKSGMSLADVLKVLYDSCNGNSEAFANLWGSAEAGKAGLAIVNGGVEEFNETAKEMGAKTNEIGEGLEKLDTPSARAQKSLNLIKNSGIELGTAFLESLQPTLEKVGNFVDKATEAFDKLPDPVKTNIATVMALITALAPVLIIGGKIISGIGSITSAIGVVGPAIAGLSGPILPIIAIIGGLVAVGVLLYQNWDTIKEKAAELKEKISEKWDNIKEKTGELKDSVVEKWNGIKEKTSEVWDNVKETMSSKMTEAKDYVKEKLDNIKSAYEENGGGLKGIAAATMETVKTKYTVAYDAINAATGGKLGEVVDKFKTKMETVKTDVGDKLSNVKESFQTKLSDAKTTVGSKMGDIATKFGEKMETAKTKVKNAIDRIKGFFSFSWSLPHLKMPHPTISGRFSLNPPSVPRFGISWYKKAMDDPMVLTKPTAFGIGSNGIRVGGEAGDEIVGGKAKIESMIREASSQGSEKLYDLMNQIFEFMKQYIPEMMSMNVCLDSGEMVGALAPAMNQELGRLAVKKGRGR